MGDVISAKQLDLAPSPSEYSYRPALDGIRCIAVCSVLVYHLDRRWLPGGFLGVDVFFTLSGYLITTLLIMERERHGRIAIADFWARRARRLLPAALVSIAAVAVWLHFQPEFVQAARRGDVLGALGNVANWRLIATGQSYFEGFATVSPLRHFWSLAIEEQFYLVWPLTCALLLRSNRLRRLATLCAVGTVLSAIWCAVLFDPVDPSRSYYGTDTRVHQLLIGALLAVWLAGRRRAGCPVLAARRFAPVGLVVLLLAICVMPDQWEGYYRGGSVAVALATALVIVGLESAQGGTLARFMGYRPAAAVGRGAYGLYLWHWPIYVWLSPGTWGLDSIWAVSIARLAVTGAVAYVSFRMIEWPIRNPAVGILRHPRTVALGSATGVVLVGVLTLTITWGASLPVWAGGKHPDRASCTAGAVPGNGLRIAIAGDSVASSLVPGICGASVSNGWQVYDGSEPACPITMLPQVQDDGTTHPQNSVCADVVPGLQQDIVDFAADVVVWHDLQSTLGLELPDKETAPAGSDRWAELTLTGWQRVLDRFRESGAKVLILMPPQRSQDQPGGCGTAQRCLDIQAQDLRIRRLTITFLEQNADDAGVHSLDLDGLLCPGGLPCPARIDGVEVRISGWDQTHFTVEGARWIAPTIADAIMHLASSAV